MAATRPSRKRRRGSRGGQRRRKSAVAGADPTNGDGDHAPGMAAPPPADQPELPENPREGALPRTSPSARSCASLRSATPVPRRGRRPPSRRLPSRPPPRRRVANRRRVDAVAARATVLPSRLPRCRRLTAAVASATAAPSGATRCASRSATGCRRSRCWRDATSSSTTCPAQRTTSARSTAISTSVECRTCSPAWKRHSSTSPRRRTQCSTAVTCSTTPRTSNKPTRASSRSSEPAS